MTLAEIEQIPRAYLWAEEVAEYLDSTADTIRWQAKQEPEKLAFPVVVTGKHVKIPKEAFVYICKFGRPVVNVEVRPETVKYYIEQAMNHILSQNKEQGG